MPVNFVEIVTCLCIYSGNRDCSDGYIKCEGPNATQLCIYYERMCDGDDHCGNNWDEEPAQCR